MSSRSGYAKDVHLLAWYNRGMTNSVKHHLRGVRPYVIALMQAEGRDFSVCEQCLEAIPNGKYDIHHTKYEGATYYDLEIVCRSCNLKAKNMGLA